MFISSISVFCNILFTRKLSRFNNKESFVYAVLEYAAGGDILFDYRVIHYTGIIFLRKLQDF